MNSSGLHLSKHDRRRYRDALMSVSWNGPLGEDLRRLCELLEEKTVAKVRTPRRKRTAAEKATKVVRLSKRAVKNAETGAIYREVERRADGKCEACGLPFSPSDPPELDHALGRGKVRQSVRNTWLIHRSEHHARHAGKPSRNHWLLIWAAHCDRYGFTTEAQKARDEVDGDRLVEQAAALTRGSR